MATRKVDCKATFTKRIPCGKNDFASVGCPANFQRLTHELRYAGIDARSFSRDVTILLTGTKSVVTTEKIGPTAGFTPSYPSLAVKDD